jgi:glycosyltransferase involved in cell wall biosynthesis
MIKGFMQPTIIIPAYQPTGQLLAVVSELLQLEDKLNILVVNDGSEPACDEIFSKLEQQQQVTLLKHATNLGKGAALKTAFNYHLVNFPTAPGAVTADADGQHSASDILKIAHSLIENPDKLIIGSRTELTAKAPLRSRFGNWLTRHVFKFFCHIGVTDTQSGLRGIPNELLQELLSSQANGYDFELDMLIHASREITIQEVPIKTIYLENNASSHFNPLSDSMKIYFLFFRFIAISVLSAVIDYGIFILGFLFSGHILLPAIGARIISGLINFKLNQSIAFKNKKQVIKKFIRYFILAVCLACVSGLITIGLKRYGITVYFGKILAEGILFLASFTIQKTFIFK